MHYLEPFEALRLLDLDVHGGHGGGGMFLLKLSDDLLDRPSLSFEDG